MQDRSGRDLFPLHYAQLHCYSRGLETVPASQPVLNSVPVLPFLSTLITLFYAQAQAFQNHSSWRLDCDEHIRGDWREILACLMGRLLFSFWVGIVTRQRAGHPTNRGSFPSTCNRFSKASRLALGPTQPPTHWVPAIPSPAVKWPGYETGHSPHLADVKNEWAPTSIPRPKYRHGVHTYFTFTVVPSGIMKLINCFQQPTFLETGDVSHF
jgi:hypothetical protein